MGVLVTCMLLVTFRLNDLATAMPATASTATPATAASTTAAERRGWRAPA